MRRPRIVPSVLNADQSRLGEALQRLEAAGIDAIQWDVMDGHFVPNLTIGAGVVKDCRAATGLYFEAHLMIEEPERWIEQYVAAGCDTVIVHPEVSVHLHRTLEEIRRLGARAGVALNPHTPLEAVRHVMGSIDHLLVMTVNPGFGGQDYIAAMEPKITEARAMIDATGREVPLEVDGGISAGTIGDAHRAGADTFVVGSALFRHPDGLAAAVAEVRTAVGLDDNGAEASGRAAAMAGGAET